MDKMTIWYVSFFLIACLALTVLALLKSLLQQQKINELLHQSDLDHAAAKDDKLKIQQLQAKLSALDNQAKQDEIDHVTGLMSWHSFHDKLTIKLREAERYHLTMALLLIDIGDLAVITDALGFEMTQALLKTIAERISTSIRDLDQVARYNETTFAVLLSQIAKPETAVIAVQRILQSLKNPYFIKGQELFITASVGIAIYPTDANNLETLQNCARQALELARATGAFNYRFYQINMHRQSQFELVVQKSMSKETFDEDFMIYYQPIINVANNKIQIMDALPYWYHSQVGNLNSTELYEYAEKHQKTDVIFAWLLENVCADYLSWVKNKKFKDDHSALIGIPMTINQLQSNFIFRITKLLQNLQFNPQCLLLEIKSVSQPLSFDVLEKSFNMLRYLKIKIGITDFGYESLSINFLKNIELDFIKLHPSFITNITENMRAIHLLESVVLLMQNMKIQLIATGVDTQEQYQLLKNIGIEYMEGPLIGLPIPRAEIEKKMTMIF